MAKGAPPKSGTSKIRFIMIDAEIAEGELGNIAQAIQNALRPVALAPPRPVAHIASSEASAEIDLSTNDAVDADEGTDVVYTSPSEAPPPRPQRPRRYATPKVLELDLTSDPSWEQFANLKSPKNDTERYLTVAAWFKDHRNVAAITTDHVYTCYRAVKWPSAIEDFNAPLRKLKNLQFFTSPDRGTYAINHLGLARVEELPKS